jgi:hypothetical protein
LLPIDPLEPVMTEIEATELTFFARYPDVFWLSEDFRYASNRVSFSFSLQAIDAQSGSSLQRSGIEHIDFDPQGRIKRLEVQTS